MENISLLSSMSVVRPVERHASIHPVQKPSLAAGGADEVTVSPLARMMSRMEDMPDVRQDLIDRVRGEIDAGGYDSPDKIDAAIDQLAEDL